MVIPKTTTLLDFGHGYQKVLFFSSQIPFFQTNGKVENANVSSTF